MRRFEHVAVGDRLHVVDGARRDAERLARLELHVLAARRSVSFTQYIELAGQQVDRLVLHVVVLHGQRLPGVDVQDLADVAVGVRPDRLVSPGLRNVLDVDGT